MYMHKCMFMHTQYKNCETMVSNRVVNLILKLHAMISSLAEWKAVQICRYMLQSHIFLQRSHTVIMSVS